MRSIHQSVLCTCTSYTKQGSHLHHLHHQNETLRKPFLPTTLSKISHTILAQVPLLYYTFVNGKTCDSILQFYISTSGSGEKGILGLIHCY